MLPDGPSSSIFKILNRLNLSPVVIVIVVIKTAFGGPISCKSSTAPGRFILVVVIIVKKASAHTAITSATFNSEVNRF
jgi:hypothetical protein